jgi:hypothetical protein
MEVHPTFNKVVCPSLGIADYSNCGEINMDGASSDFNGNTGTSYAAPKFSYNVALYLIDNNFSQCTGTNNAAYEVFGYADESGPWLNFGFDAAFNDFCILGTPTP